MKSLLLTILGASGLLAQVQMPVTVTFPYTPINRNQINVANGVAGLDANGKFSWLRLTGIPTIQSQLGYTPENVANKGQMNGYASLGADRKVPSSQLPPPMPGPVGPQGPVGLQGPPGPMTPTATALQGTGPFRMVAGADPKIQVTSCGPGSTISGSDSAGIVVVGSGEVDTCTIVFVIAFANPPICTVNNNTRYVAVKPIATAKDLTVAGQSPMDGDTLSYICIGR